jgi:hypothetical protein
MLASEHTGILGKRRNDVLDELIFGVRVGLVIGDIHAITGREPDSQHNLRHSQAP